MGNRNVPFAEHEYYHIYNRGNSKQVIFREPDDYERFQALLYLSNSFERFVFREIDEDKRYFIDRGTVLVDIEAYCLMPNHFHILLTQKVDNGISLFMKKVSTGYSMYFNKKYERTGSLFEGAFKSQHADSDEYLKYLYSYIHLNPVKLIQPLWREEGVKNINHTFEYLRNYTYSSYPDISIGETYGNREEQKIIKSSLFTGYFSTPEEHQQELLSWLTYQEVSP
jgi:putative transposase